MIRKIVCTAIWEDFVLEEANNNSECLNRTFQFNIDDEIYNIDNSDQIKFFCVDEIFIQTNYKPAGIANYIIK